MNYEQFVEAMYEMCKKMAAETDLVEKQQVLKNNGVYKTGLSIRPKNKNVSPIIYLDGFYTRYLQGESLETLCQWIIEKSRQMPEPPSCEYERVMELSTIQSRAAYKLVNFEQNRELLKKIPHLPLMDLAVIFYIILSVDAQESCSVLITNEHLASWKLPISVLYQYASQNTPRLLPPVFVPLEEQFPEIFRTEETCPLYLLTNEAGVNGASVLLYEQIPKLIAEQLKDQYYLLPSSIHEFLIIPMKEAPEPERLRAMVREINATQVDAEERLSDDIYYFDGSIVTKM